jgi:hypothetical protein
MNRHWSISTHLVTDQKTRIIQLRRSKLSKRRILLRNNRSTLLDKKNHSTERIERFNPFDLDISQFNSLSRTVVRAKENSSSRFTKDDWTFSKQTSSSFFFSQSTFFSVKFLSTFLSVKFLNWLLSRWQAKYQSILISLILKIILILTSFAKSTKTTSFRKQ